jgi:hypothetical protein
MHENIVHLERVLCTTTQITQKMHKEVREHGRLRGHAASQTIVCARARLKQKDTEHLLVFAARRRCLIDHHLCVCVSE